MNLVDINIELLIPQRKPFIMIDHLLDYKEDSARTSFVVKEDNVLVQNGFFSEEGMIENMAQTAATYLGYDSYIKGLDAPVGFIAAVKNLKILANIKQETKIVTTIKFSNTILNINIVDAEIKQDDKIVAQAELRIFINE